MRWVHGMSSTGLSVVSDIRVRYAETDAMKVVYHGNYLIYFEQARTEMLRRAGIPYSAIERMGIFVVVVEAHVKYRRPASYDDLLHVKAMVREMPSNRITIEYEITRNDDPEVIVEGSTLHTFLTAETNRPTRPPEEFIELMKHYF